jgi:hypothetical protein
MAYVPGVKNDLFISYAHVDNEHDPQSIRWVSEFVRGFGLLVRQRLGGPSNFTLFFDESDLHAHHQLQILLENARRSAVFVAVLSPSYVAHDWTMQELREFAGIAGDHKRIVVVEKLPLHESDRYPAEIESHKRTQFWRINPPESYAPSTLTAIGEAAAYKQTLETLAHQVQQLLREMRKAAKDQGLTEEPPLPPPRPKPPPVAEPAAAKAPPSKPAPPAEPTLQYATVENSPVGAADAGRTTLLDVIWPRPEDSWGLREIAFTAAVAALAASLAFLFRGAISSPSNPVLGVSVTILALVCFHLMAIGSGRLMGTFGAIVAAVIGWFILYDLVPASARTGFGGAFVAMVPAAMILGLFADRGWSCSFWRTALATFLAAAVFGVCVFIGIWLNESQQGRGAQLFRSMSVEIGATVVGACAAIIAGYALVAAAIFYFVRRWALRRFA